MLAEGRSYEDLVAGFRWRVPERYNIAVSACLAWAAADPERPALVVPEAGGLRTVSYVALAAASARLANVLAAHGVGRGDRVAVLLPQGEETVLAHLAAYRLGAVALPLAVVFGADALLYRLADSGARAVVATAAAAERIAEIRDRLPALRLVLVVDGAAPGAVELAGAMARASDRHAPVDTGPDDPALLIYTSGTTGLPKPALHGHRVLLGHLPAIAMHHGFAPKPGDRFWTPADWAWAGGLLNCLLPALHLGVAVVVHPAGKFDPEATWRLLEDAEVRNAFLPPTALRMMRNAPIPVKRPSLRTIGAAGEALGASTREWGLSAFGVPIDEFYGQTEANAVLSSSAALGIGRAGAIGKPVPGHAVVLLGRDGTPVPPGTAGEIAVRRPDPVMFLGYAERPEATAERFAGDFMLTGDQAVVDEDGYFHFIGRNDDIITSAGYRIGPGEVEDCLVGHPAVAMAVVVGKPDPLRTEIVVAFVTLVEGVAPSPALADAIRDHVRTRLSAHEYPREVHFVPELPLTATGKVIRRRFRETVGAL